MQKTKLTLMAGLALSLALVGCGQEIENSPSSQPKVTVGQLQSGNQTLKSLSVISETSIAPSLAFGDLIAGSSRTVSTTITNNDNSTILVQNGGYYPSVFNANFVNFSKIELQPGESTTLTVTGNCNYGIYADSADKGSYVIYATVGSQQKQILIPVTARCIRQPEDAGPIIAYSLKMYGGQCGANFNAWINPGTQNCFASPLEARNWADLQITSAVNYMKQFCPEPYCEVDVTDYQPGGGFTDESMSRHAIIRYK